MLLDPDIGQWWMNLVRPVPLLGEIYYSGWGIGRYHWLLAAGQGLLSVLVLVAAAAFRKRAGATPQSEQAV
jgi:hypothetical protein